MTATDATTDAADAIAVYEEMADTARRDPTLVWIDQYGQEHPA